MFAVRKIVQAAPRSIRLAGQQRGFVSGPPRVRIPFPEKVAHGLLIAAGICTVPLWVLHHMAEYRGKPEEDDD